MQKIKIIVVDDHAVLSDGIRALVGLHDDLRDIVFTVPIIGDASEPSNDHARGAGRILRSLLLIVA